MLGTLLIAVAAASSGGNVAVPRPSVVVITLDTTRADHLGCYGAARAATPNIDALARNGVRFTQAQSPVPLTLPSHASLFSGRVPRRHGVRDNEGFRLDAGVPLLAERLGAAGYTTAAFVSAAVLDRSGGLDRGFSIYDDAVRVGDRRAFDYQERAASQTIDALLLRLPSLTPPFFLWLHLYDPHLPYVPPEPFATRFAGRLYDGEIAFLDSQLGRLLDAFKRKGITPLIVVAGDHGESLGEHGERGHGVFLYQATQHVPLILLGPGLPAGTTVEATVGLVDVAPTILDLLGLPALPDTDGRSLLPLARGGRLPAADYEMETFYPSFSYGWAPLRALRSGPYKYIEAPRAELYELPTDPRETRNLARSAAKRVGELSHALDGRLGDDRTPTALEAPDPDERHERLSSLGYVSGSKAPATGAIDPKDGIALLADLDVARRAVQLGDPHDAIAPMNRILAKNPTNIPARLTLGQAQIATGRVDDAIATYRAVTKLAPNNPFAWSDLGNAYARRGPKDDAAVAEAKRCYEQALTLAPRHADTYLNLAMLQAARGAQAEAYETLQRARRAHVSDPEIETELGMLEVGRKDFDAAGAAFDRALALDPRQGEALEGQGRMAYAAGDYARAATYYGRALSARPEASTAKTLGAIQLYHLNDRAAALASFSRALALSPPNDPDVADLRALVDDLRK